MAPVKPTAAASTKGKAKATVKSKMKTTASAGVQSTPTPPTRQARQARQTQLVQQIQQTEQTQRPPAPTHTQFEAIQPLQQISEPVQLQNIESFLQPQPLQRTQSRSHQSFQQSWNLQSPTQTWDLQSPTFSSTRDMPQFQQTQFGTFGPFEGMQQPQQMPYQFMQNFQGMQQMQHQPGFYFEQPQHMQPQMQPQSFPFLQQSQFMQQQPYSPIQQPYSPMQQFQQRQSHLFPSFDQMQQLLYPLQQQSPPVFQGNFGQMRRPQNSRRSAATFTNLLDDEEEEEEEDDDDDYEEKEEDGEEEEEEEEEKKKEKKQKRPVRNKRLTQASTKRSASTKSGETNQQTGFTFKQTETQATQKKRLAAIKRRAEEDHEESSRKKTKMGRPSNDRNGRCDHCFENNIEDCDWKIKRLTGPMECTQCSDFRLSSGNIHHTCTAPGYAEGLYRDYSANHPIEYPDMTCLACVKRKRHGKCDIDMLLGYGCTWTNKKVGGCKIPGSDIGFARRPGNAAQVKRWFRRACDSCHSRALTAPQQAVPCSWLKLRDKFGSACDECKELGITCFDGVNIVEQPLADPAQNNNITLWSYEFFGHREGFIELSKNSRGRYMCQQCDEDGTHCRISPRRPFASCSRCSTMGIDCIEKTVRGQTPREFPIHSLATVGFGTVAPFHSCQRCIEMSRNCDRQRPCDSCLNNNESTLCDVVRSRVALAANGQLAGRKNVFKGRLVNPGPLYYLAMGYGGGGVDDRKDGSQLEHWYGPFGPIYARTSLDFAPNGHVCDMQNKRSVLRPEGPPPQGLTTADMPSRLTVERLRQLLLTRWPNAIPMNQHEYWHLYGSAQGWAACVAAANRRDREAGEKAEAKRDGGPPKKPKKRAGDDEEDADDGNEDVDDEDGKGEEVDSLLSFLGGDAVDLNATDNATAQQAWSTQAATEVLLWENDVSLENYEFFTALTEAGLDDGQQPAADANGDEDVDMIG